MDQTPPSPGASRAGGGRAAASTLHDVERLHAALARIRLEGASFDGVLEQVAHLARTSIPAADVVSVTLVDGEGPRTAASTGDLALQLDQRQYDLGEGPCLDAAQEQRAVSLPDLATEERYPGFVPRARQAGVRAVTSVSMVATPRVVAGLNVYSLQEPGGHEAVAVATRDFVDAAAAAVANAALVSTATHAADDLRRAMATRAVIEQAKGLMVGRLGCTPERAFDLLAEQSQHTNRKLRDIAVELVQEAQRRQPPPRPPG